jgi:hypothetical protein
MTADTHVTERLYFLGRIPALGGRPEPDLLCYRSSEHWELLYPGIGRFAVSNDGREVVTLAREEEADDLVRAYAQGPIRAFAQQLQGMGVLHGNAVAVEGGALAFVAHAGTGKSTLAASWVAAGYPFVADDLVPVDLRDSRLLVLPGQPQMKLWPPAIAHTFGDPDRFPRLFPISNPRCQKRFVALDEIGAPFVREALPLRAVYFLRRGDGADKDLPEICIESIPPSEAVIALITHTFAVGLIDSAQQVRWLDVYSRIADRLPVRRLIYPGGLDHLPRVREAVLRDLGRRH